MNFAEKKKKPTTTACMSKKFDMIQRTNGRFKVSWSPLYQFSEILYHVAYEHAKNISGSKREKNKNIQLRFSLSCKIRRSYKKKSVLRTTFFLKFERGLYVVSGVSSGLFTLMGDASRLFHKKATV